MLKRIAVIAIILSIMAGLCPVAGAQSAQPGFDDRLLKSIVLELEQAETTRALVRMGSGGMESAKIQDMVGALYKNGSVVIFFNAGGRVVSGQYLEPDLVKHCSQATSSIGPDDADTLSVGDELGLDRLQEIVKKNTQTITVAVLDTGVDTSHQWFQGRIVSPYNAANENNSPIDENGHGTHIAGTIARNTPKKIKIMPVKVFTDEGDAPDSIIVRGIDYAVKHGANVINLSLGGYGTTSYLDKAIDFAVSQGVTVVTSAGNDAKDVSHFYPAAFPEVITVGAVGRNGDLLYFSNTGDAIDVCAPGENISSAAPGNMTESRSGTSMAAPFVASAAALLILENPARTPAEVERILRNNTFDLGSSGKDKLFGYGEISFENYETNSDFYMIEDGGAIPAEEKFNLNLSYYAGSLVSRVEILIDGETILEASSSEAGEKKLSLDIRKLSVGTHALEIRALMNDGTLISASKRDFAVPEYNVRIKVYDVNNKLVSNPVIDVLGFSSGDKNVERLETEPVTVNGVWMTNLDFDLLSKKYDKIRCSVRSIPDGVQSEIPFYLRITGTTGEKIFEPSGCYMLGFSSKDKISGCTVETRILGGSLNGFENVEAWGGNAYEAGISSADIPFVAMDGDNGEPLYGGLFYYDTGNLWLDVYSYSGGQRTKADENGASWYYSGNLDDAGGMLNLTASSQLQLSIKTDIAGMEPSRFILVNIPSGDSVLNVMNGQTGSIGVMPGIYDLFLLSKRSLKDGKIAQDAFFTSFYNTEGKRLGYSFGKSIEDRFIYDSSRKEILHRWVDAYGNGYTVAVQGPDGSDLCIPVLSLTDKAGAVTKINGTDLPDAGDYIHGYSLAGMPDGTYRASFINKSDALACPIKTLSALINIKNGEVSNPGNTPPAAFTDYISQIRPGDLFVYDLKEEFTDKEQDKLEFSATSGWIVDGIFFYRDLIGEDTDITISAYDGAGGSASFTHSIRVTDRTAPEDSYAPNPDIDSIGAATWAVPFVKKAILAGIVPAYLLDNYQSSITRQEFSALVVKMAGLFLGEITPSPDISFKDTRDENILKAATKKFLSGSNGYFNPDQNLSRQQLCVIVYQTLKVIRPGLVKPVKKAPQFKDSREIAPWAKVAVDFCAANGIIEGSGGVFNPKGQTSREQAIMMLYRAYLLCR